MSCRPLPDWSKDKRCIYALDTFDDIFVFGDVWSYTKHLQKIGHTQKIGCKEETLM